MTLERDLAPDLERSLAHLPSVPATSYLAAARKVRRRRRALTGAAASVALVGGLVLAPALLDSPSPTPVASPGAGLGEEHVPLDPRPVTDMPGLQGVEAFTTDRVPHWAQEHGNNGPVAIAPDGRLWVAPGAEVTRTILNPHGDPDLPEDRTYAVEATYEGEERWVLLPNLMEPPALWTNDFGLWTESATASEQGLPSFSDRLVRFAGPGSEQLVARQGTQLVRQRAGVELPSTYEQHPRSSVAEVRWGGRTWFVLAQGPGNGAPFYSAYEQAVSAPDLDSFLAWLEDRA